MDISTKMIPAAVLALLLAACSHHRNLEADFGNSARNLIEAQTYDRNVALNPEPTAPERLHGQYSEAFMQVYRSDVGDPKAVKRNITVDVFNE